MKRVAGILCIVSLSVAARGGQLRITDVCPHQIPTDFRLPLVVTGEEMQGTQATIDGNPVNFTAICNTIGRIDCPPLAQGIHQLFLFGRNGQSATLLSVGRPGVQDIEPTIECLSGDISAAGSGGCITNQDVAGSLLAKLDSAVAAVQRADYGTARHIIVNGFLQEIEAQAGRTIDTQFASLVDNLSTVYLVPLIFQQEEPKPIKPWKSPTVKSGFGNLTLEHKEPEKDKTPTVAVHVEAPRVSTDMTTTTFKRSGFSWGKDSITIEVFDGPIEGKLLYNFGTETRLDNSFGYLKIIVISPCDDCTFTQIIRDSTFSDDTQKVTRHLDPKPMTDGHKDTPFTKAEVGKEVFSDAFHTDDVCVFIDIVIPYPLAGAGPTPPDLPFNDDFQPAKGDKCTLIDKFSFYLTCS